jgi:hypothetical protein
MHSAIPFRFRTSCLAKRDNDAVVFEHCFRFHPSHGWLVGARTFVHIVPFLRFLLRRSRDFDLLIAALLDRCASALDLAASLVCVRLVVALTIIEAKRKVSSRCVKCVSVRWCFSSLMTVQRLFLWMLCVFQYKGSTCAAILFVEVVVLLSLLLF